MAQTSGDEGRIGLFGGTFNPLHVGHINVVTAVRQRLGLDKIVVVPAARNPKRHPIEGPTPEQRLEMLTLGLAEYDFVEIDDQELKRGGLSFTVDMVEAWAKKVPAEDLYLIIGLDQFEEFDSWKDFKRILELANLIVVSRPGHHLPFGVEDFPEKLRELITVFDRSYATLSTGRGIEFLRLNDVDVSASDIRKKLRSGRAVDRYLTLPVENWIREQGLFTPLADRIGDIEPFMRFCATTLHARKGIDVRAFDLRGTDAPADFTLVASGTSTRHATSMAEAVSRAVKEEYNVLPQSLEGASEGRWVLLDYGVVIVHVFYDYVRQEYRLEDLWRAGIEMNVSEKVSEKASEKTEK